MLRNSRSAMNRLMFKSTLDQAFDYALNLLIVLAYCALWGPRHPEACLSWGTQNWNTGSQSVVEVLQLLVGIWVTGAWQNCSEANLTEPCLVWPLGLQHQLCPSPEGRCWFSHETWDDFSPGYHEMHMNIKAPAPATSVSYRGNSNE